MDKVLTTASTVICGHGGTALLTSTAKLTVSGQPVLLQSAAASWGFTVTPCGQATPCTNIVTLQTGVSTKLTVGGQAVVLDSVTGTTNGTPDTTNLTATANQSKLESV